MDEGLRRLVIVVAVLTAAVLALILILSLFMVLMMGWMMSGGVMSGMMGRIGGGGTIGVIGLLVMAGVVLLFLRGPGGPLLGGLRQPAPPPGVRWVLLGKRSPAVFSAKPRACVTT